MFKESQYYELDQEIIEYFNSIERGFVFALDFKYLFQSNNKQKRLISIKKLPDNYAVLLQAEILVTINDAYFDKLDDESKKILIEQEIDKIIPNLEKGTFSISQPTMKTSAGIVNKYTYEKVERAHEIEKTLAKQKDEEETN